VDRGRQERAPRRAAALGQPLARLEGAPPNRVARFVAERALYRSRAFDVDAFHVYSSQLHPKGAVYTLEESYPLDAAGDFGDWDEDEI